jgi:hypothetical protein
MDEVAAVIERFDEDLRSLKAWYADIKTKPIDEGAKSAPIVRLMARKLAKTAAELESEIKRLAKSLKD